MDFAEAGAGKIDRLKKGIRKGALLYVCGAAAITAFCLTFSGPIYRLFSSDPDVLRIGMALMRFIAPFWVTFVAVEILSSSIRACGDSLNTMLITALGIGLFRIVWILFYPGRTVFDTLRCYPISWILTGTLFIIYYLRGTWLKRSLKQRESLKNSQTGAFKNNRGKKQFQHSILFFRSMRYTGSGI